MAYWWVPKPWARRDLIAHSQHKKQTPQLWWLVTIICIAYIAYLVNAKALGRCDLIAPSTQLLTRSIRSESNSCGGWYYWLLSVNASHNSGAQGTTSLQHRGPGQPYTCATMAAEGSLLFLGLHREDKLELPVCCSFVYHNLVFAAD